MRCENSGNLGQTNLGTAAWCSTPGRSANRMGRLRESPLLSEPRGDASVHRRSFGKQQLGKAFALGASAVGHRRKELGRWHEHV